MLIWFKLVISRLDIVSNFTLFLDRCYGTLLDVCITSLFYCYSLFDELRSSLRRKCCMHSFSIFLSGCNPMPSAWNIYIYAQSAQSCWWQRKVKLKGTDSRLSFPPQVAGVSPCEDQSVKNLGTCVYSFTLQQKVAFLGCLSQRLTTMWDVCTQYIWC